MDLRLHREGALRMEDTPFQRAHEALSQVPMWDGETIGHNLTRDEIAAGVRAVLEAIREPSEGMFEAGLKQAEECTDAWSASASCIAQHVWQSMIDKVFEDGNG